MKTVSLRSLRSLLKSRFKGVLLKGAHGADSKACALELHSQAIGIEWTDDPVKNHTWDLRSLNDIDVSNEVRAKWMLPVIAAYSGSMDWPEKRQQEVRERLVVLLMKKVIAELLSLPEENRKQCREVKDLKTAEAAARAAEAAARAAGAARAAAGAAQAAAWAAAGAAQAAAGAAQAAAWAAGAARAAAGAAQAAAGAAQAAAGTAEAGTAEAAARAAEAAARAAEAAARAAGAARAAAREKVFIDCCKIWLRAAKP